MTRSGGRLKAPHDVPACEPPRGRDRWVAAGENRTAGKKRPPPLGPSMLGDRAEAGPNTPIALKKPFR